MAKLKSERFLVYIPLEQKSESYEQIKNLSYLVSANHVSTSIERFNKNCDHIQIQSESRRLTVELKHVRIDMQFYKI